METKKLTRQGGRAECPPAVTATPAVPPLPTVSIVGQIRVGAVATLRTGAQA